MLRNDVVFVTGSSRGIGKAIAAAFAHRGCRVIINCAHSAEELEKTRAELALINSDVTAIMGDVSDYNTACDVFDKINAKYGGADILVNNAGISYVGLFNTMKCNDWQRIMDVNFGSVLNCTHIAVQNMIRRKHGCIINISSMWGAAGASCEAVYSASKGAVNAFSKAMAKELAPCGIRVNAIACGAVDTSMNGFLSEDEKNDFCAEIPLGRFASPDEIASAAVYTALDGTYITGQIIGVDGGMT